MVPFELLKFQMITVLQSEVALAGLKQAQGRNDIPFRWKREKKKASQLPENKNWQPSNSAGHIKTTCRWQCLPIYSEDTQLHCLALLVTNP